METTNKVETYTTSMKRRMLLDAIELCYKTGTNATFLVGRVLSYYDYDKLLILIKELNQENMEQGGDDFFEYKENYPYSYY
jgi:hypothetical protein